eukprot:1144053-Pelagomonas_calceolata.AAC.1
MYSLKSTEGPTFKDVGFCWTPIIVHEGKTQQSALKPAVAAHCMCLALLRFACPASSPPPCPIRKEKGYIAEPAIRAA